MSLCYILLLQSLLLAFTYDATFDICFIPIRNAVDLHKKDRSYSIPTLEYVTGQAYVASDVRRRMGTIGYVLKRYAL